MGEMVAEKSTVLVQDWSFVVDTTCRAGGGDEEERTPQRSAGLPPPVVLKTRDKQVDRPAAVRARYLLDARPASNGSVV